MSDVTGEVSRHLASLRVRLAARAAGAWRLFEGERLEQLGFSAAPDMALATARGFATASRLVSLHDRSLGIVLAAVERRRTVSFARDLPADRGSGYWLRAFGAERSVAVPIEGPDGLVVGVVSVALNAGGVSDDDIEARIRDEATAWFSEPETDAL
jgi:hypothetical protein